MAKGFTVKAKNPTKAKADAPEFDYDKAREMVRGKSVVFCLPGRGVSYQFLNKNNKEIAPGSLGAGPRQFSTDFLIQKLRKLLPEFLGLDPRNFLPIS